MSVPAQTSNRIETAARKVAANEFRNRIDIEYHRKQLNAIASDAMRYAMLGDKDAIPGLRLAFDVHRTMIGKVVADVKAIDIQADGDSIPTLVLDMTGRQAYNPSDVIDGETTDDDVPTVSFDAPERSPSDFLD
jgi:hypothetical protein